MLQRKLVLHASTAPEMVTQRRQMAADGAVLSQTKISTWVSKLHSTYIFNSFINQDLEIYCLEIISNYVISYVEQCLLILM